MAPRLKVFVTSDGFNDYIVAVSSRAKALEAWGAHQDLFQTGGARETNDAEMVEAALADPGKVVRRAAAAPMPIPARKSAGPRIAPKAAPSAERAPPPKVAPPPPPKPKPPPKPRGPTPAQLRKIAELQAQLEAVTEQHEEELAEIAAEKRALEQRRDASESRFLARRAELREALRKARLVLR